MIAMVRTEPLAAMAIMTCLVWIAVVFLGRLIAYDQIWGPLSPTKAV